MAGAVRQGQGVERRTAWPEAGRCSRYHRVAGPIVRRQPRSSVERGASVGGDHDHVIGHCEGHGSATSWESSAPEAGGERRLDVWTENDGNEGEGVRGEIIAKEEEQCGGQAGESPSS